MDTPFKKLVLLLLLILLLFSVLFVGYALYTTRTNAQPNTLPADATETHFPPTPSPLNTLTSASTTETPAPLPSATQVATANNTGLLEQGAIILALRDGNNIHLFGYHPQYYPLTRLTNNTWDDISPTISPDGTRLAFGSRRNGYWDIYVLNLLDNQLTRITDTPEYDGFPTWSPDGEWLAYESLVDNNLEILISSINTPADPPIRLTNDPGLDSAPTWSPSGREIAFVSNRSGDNEIWLAHLDQSENRFTNISRLAESNEEAPAWSPDARYLAWSSNIGSSRKIHILDLADPTRPARENGIGDSLAWSPDGNTLLTANNASNHNFLAFYHQKNGDPLYPFLEIPGKVYGFDWQAGSFAAWLAQAPIEEDARQPHALLWQPVYTTNNQPPAGRKSIAALDGVSAPYPYLHDGVDESFQNLRRQVIVESGWNYLDSLENAIIPITEAPPPKMEQNWLYTGRAFATNPMPLYAGWLVIVKEELEAQTYWRVYIKTRFQDGSQGMPLKSAPWDITSRTAGDPHIYEAGGQQTGIPQGYWIDFSELAGRYDWKRLPALATWRTYFPAARFNQFYLNDTLDWESAMSELYPPEALATATRIPTRTYTPSLTPTINLRNPVTETPIPLPTEIPTRRPTWTSIP